MPQLPLNGAGACGLLFDLLPRIPDSFEARSYGGFRWEISRGSRSAAILSNVGGSLGDARLGAGPMSLPAGWVTLLFTDIEGGLRLWETDRDAMATASARNDHIVRERVEACGGIVFKAVADAHRAVFADPVAALLSAMAIQRAVAAEPWVPSAPVRVRIALHCGACAERGCQPVPPSELSCIALADPKARFCRDSPTTRHSSKDCYLDPR